MPKREVSDEEVEDWFEVIRRCLESTHVWSDVIKKFPPATLKHLVRRLLERIYSANADPREFDWCVLIDGIETYPSIDAFFSALEKNQLIPPDPERFYKEMIEFYEKELAKLGYRIVDEETYKSTTRVSEIQKEIKELKKIIKELQEKLEMFAKGAHVDVSVEVPALRRELESMNWEKYVQLIKDMLRLRGFPDPFTEKLIAVKMDTIRELFLANKTISDTYQTLLEEILANIVVLSGSYLQSLGVQIRPVREVIRYGRWVKVKVESTVSSWEIWADKLGEMGYRVHKDLVPFDLKVNIIHDPFKETSQVVCGILKGNIIPEYKDRIVGCSTPTIIYLINEERKEVYWMFYKELMILRT